MFFQYSLSASCSLKIGELVMTLYCRPWKITSLPPTYCRIAESPEASEIDRCRVDFEPFGRLGARMTNGSPRSASTASATVAWLSRTYCAQAEIDSRGFPATGLP
jgi:hypothetical protein